MKINLQFCWILWSVLLLGCEKVISIDLPDSEPVLVVNSLFSPDSVWQVRVTASQAIDVSTEPPAVTNATVVILENGIPIDTLVHDSADMYVSARGRKPVADHAYTLRASAPGFADVQGSDMTPRVVIANNLSFQDSVFLTQGEQQYRGEFSFTIHDWPGQRNYYLLDIYTVYHFIWDSTSITQVGQVGFASQDPILDTKTSYGQALFDDATFEGQSHTIKVYFAGIAGHNGSSDTIYARLSVVTEPCFRYLQTMAKYNNAQFDPFAEPVRLYSNMTSGMGVFAGRAGYDMFVP
jgi:Domain of unknown function (DUF4249)